MHKRHLNRRDILNLFSTLAISLIVSNNGFAQTLDESGIANFDQHQGYQLALLAVIEDEREQLMVDTIWNVPKFSTVEWGNLDGQKRGFIALCSKDGIRWEFIADSTFLFPYEDDEGETQIGTIYYDMKVINNPTAMGFDWAGGFNILFKSKNKIEFFRLITYRDEEYGIFGNWDVKLPQIYVIGNYSII